MFHLLCPARLLLHLLPRPPGNRPPSIQELYSEQRRWRCRTKQHPDNTTKTRSAVTAPPPTTTTSKKKNKKKKHTHKKNGCFYPHIPRFLSRLDKMNTSPQPAPSYQLLYFFSLFFAFSLTMMQSATKEHVAQMSSHWIYRCCPPFKTLSGCCVQTDKLGPAAIFQYWRPSPHPPTCMRVH